MGRITEYLWYLNNDVKEDKFFWIELTEKDRKIKKEITKKEIDAKKLPGKLYLD